MQDVARAVAFYRDLGWPQVFDSEDFVAFELRGTVLTLFPVEKLAADARAPVELGTGGIRCSVIISVREPDEVDRLTARAQGGRRHGHQGTHRRGVLRRPRTRTSRIRTGTSGRSRTHRPTTPCPPPLDGPQASTERQLPLRRVRPGVHPRRPARRVPRRLPWARSERKPASRAPSTFTRLSSRNRTRSRGASSRRRDAVEDLTVRLHRAQLVGEEPVLERVDHGATARSSGPSGSRWCCSDSR